MADASLLGRFLAAGFDQKGAELAVKSKYAKAFAEMLDEAKAPSDVGIANLLLNFTSKYPTGCTPAARRAVLDAIVSRGIKDNKQLDAAIKYAKKPVDDGAAWNQKEFEAAAGVGVVVTHDQIKVAVSALIAKEKATLLEQRYRVAAKLLGQLITDVAWADGGLLKTEFDSALLALLGPKTDDDLKKVKAPVKEEKKEEAKAASASAAGAAAGGEPAAAAIDWLDMLNGRELPEARNTAAILAQHTKVTGGKPITRFPPEPNGYLHIGHAVSRREGTGGAWDWAWRCSMLACLLARSLHGRGLMPCSCLFVCRSPALSSFRVCASLSFSGLSPASQKAMNFNFGLATKFGGKCIMRFDDTNPEAEKGEYIDVRHTSGDSRAHPPDKGGNSGSNCEHPLITRVSCVLPLPPSPSQNIIENLNWLGHKPSRVTYSSDYFQQLYDLAVKLIRKGKAYVDHQTADEIRKSRETKIPSPWRERPIEESIKLFEDMRKGKFAEGKATLRMKGDMNAANPQMWDLVAYRIKYCEHPRQSHREGEESMRTGR